MKTLIVIFLSFLTLDVFAGEALMRVSYSPHRSFPDRMKTIKIVSTNDNLIVQKVVINRGNCEVTNSASYTNNKPIKLKYGHAIEVHTWSNCNILEMKVSTNYGVIPINWN